MDVHIQQFNKEISKDLIVLITKKYGTIKNFDYFLADYKKALDFCIDNENVETTSFSVYEDKNLIAHIALIFDTRLPLGEAFFGFFEMPHDVDIFKSVWAAVLRHVTNRKITVLKGPVNGSIWHQYRCIFKTDGSDFFKSEPLAETYYYDFLKSVNPVTEITYHSGYRERFDAILQAGQAAYDKLNTTPYRVEEIDSGSVTQLRQIADISRIVFKNSWGFVNLNDGEFASLYSAEKLSSNESTIYVLYHDKTPIGFCGVFKEDERTLICKTMAILPEYQGTGLGNALAFKVHLDARCAGYKKIIYALVRESNKIQHFPKNDVVLCRTYSAFEYNIN